MGKKGRGGNYFFGGGGGGKTRGGGGGGAGQLCEGVAGSPSVPLVLYQTLII